MKKKIIGIFAAIMVMAFAAVSFANPAWHGGPGHGPVKRDGKFVPRELTAQERSEMATFMAEKNKIREDYLKAEVKAGRMSKEVADAHIVLMNDHLAKFKEGKRPEFTEEARVAREAYHEKLRELRIEQVKKSMASGTLSKERGERILERLENAKNNKDGYGYYHRGEHRGYRDGYHRGGDRY